MVLWQNCRPECWEARGPEFNPRPGRVGVRFLYKLGQPTKTFISYSLLSVAQLLGEITLKSFVFISYHHVCYLCRLHIQKSSPSFMCETPLKKGGEPFFRKNKFKKQTSTKRIACKSHSSLLILSLIFECRISSIVNFSSTSSNGWYQTTRGKPSPDPKYTNVTHNKQWENTFSRQLSHKSMRESGHEYFMRENFISMHENGISMH